MFPVATLYFITFSSTDFFSMIKDGRRLDGYKDRTPGLTPIKSDKYIQFNIYRVCCLNIFNSRFIPKCYQSRLEFPT